ncbi:hypothetical protein GE21DRAFT_1313434 [Neurospora crassa]|nr:hypothetical protein GE21DRAFT_1313434 [Neurospora crassa]
MAIYLGDKDHSLQQARTSNRRRLPRISPHFTYSLYCANRHLFGTHPHTHTLHTSSHYIIDAHVLQVQPWTCNELTIYPILQNLDRLSGICAASLVGM